MEEIEELVLYSINKDEEAFTKLIQLVQNDLYRIAQTRLNDIEDINDAIQDTMVIAYNSIKHLKNPQHFKAWIIKILINECNKIYKKNSKKLLVFKKLTKDNNAIQDNKYINNIENKLQLDEMFKNLNHDEKLCITLFYNSNYSIAEISEILNTSPNTIKSRITRGKAKIKKYYNGGVENEPAKK